MLLSYLFINSTDGSLIDGKDGVLHLRLPDDVDVCIELKDWLFALEGAQEMAGGWFFYNNEDVGREERCWHASFQSLQLKAKSSPKIELNGKEKPNGKLKYPVELVTVRNSLSLGFNGNIGFAKLQKTLLVVLFGFILCKISLHVCQFSVSFYQYYRLASTLGYHRISYTSLFKWLHF